MRYTPIDSNLFIQNRKRLANKMAPGSIAFFNSNDEFPRNGDMAHKYRQNSDLFYLSGIDQEESILVIFPDSPIAEYKEVLFVKKTNEHIEIWEGHKYSKEEATATSGIKNVQWLEDFDTIRDMLMKRADNVYLNANENDRYVHAVDYRDMRFGKALKNLFPNHQYHRAAPFMRDLRAIKSAEEIRMLQNACDITEKAFRRVLKFVKPGVNEYEIEAEVIHEFIRNGATGHGYNPIVASGRNACVLHYNDNDKICKDGDLILFDFGAEYGNYNADLSRTIPVNGRFTPRQKDVYNAVRHVMVEAMKLLKPGNVIDEYHKQVGELMTEQLLNLKLLSTDEVKNQNPKLPAYKKFFMHGTSHHLGLDVHDLGDRHAKMEPGMVFTCEPGIYILPEEIGIRLENDMVVTSGEVNDMMRNIPIEADEIEEIMNS
ncbi:MAG: Xaa-Pro aminopeptidase [Sphingobacteriales bacterium]|jgi:Xaa-Pro aminopeptidase